MAAAVLARRCIQHLIRIKLAIKKRDLFQEIEEAVKRPELTKPTQDSLHHVREIGNWSAHPSTDQAETIIDVDAADAEYTIDVVELLFVDLYVTPAHAAAMRARIDAKKKRT
ncbi:MAG: DUF4145 domain-containing protein [Planctomycetes bacterium]|nr:DUF4145 domain-containing protein [Planctomycetota bacterium]